MNLSKLGNIDISEITGTVHIIGCGSVGSTIAELLARYGLERFVLYDDDIVSEHNIVNQMFVAEHIGKSKTESLKNIITSINPKAEVKIKDRYTKDSDSLSGYVFLCVDNIDTRREIATEERDNPSIVCMSDCRTGYLSSQAFFANWEEGDSVDKFLETMGYTQSEGEHEADKTGNRSACGLEFCVAPTVRLICTYTVLNFINFVTNNGKAWEKCFCYNTPNNTEVQTF